MKFQFHSAMFNFNLTRSTYFSHVIIVKLLTTRLIAKR